MKVIISLTTIHRRLFFLKYALQSLLDQTVSPDAIVLNVSREPYLLDAGIAELPPWLSGESFRKIDVNWVANEGPYRKLIPVLERVGDDDIIITVDDDQIYGRHCFEILMRAARDHPTSIVCGRARQPRLNAFGGDRSYSSWREIDCDCESHELIPTGNCGVVYRKPLLDIEFATDRMRLQLAPTSDDLWFREASSRMATSVRVVSGINKARARIKAAGQLCEMNSVRGEAASSRGVVRRVGEIAMDRGLGYFGRARSGNDLALKRIRQYSRMRRDGCTVR